MTSLPLGLQWMHVGLPIQKGSERPHELAVNQITVSYTHSLK